MCITRKLTEALAPTALEVINESHLHQGHAGDNGTGESHFHVKVAAECLRGLSRVEAQRRVYSALETELKGSIHALSITIIT